MVDERFGPNDRRKDTWDIKREKKLAGMNADDAEAVKKKAAWNAKYLKKKMWGLTDEEKAMPDGRFGTNSKRRDTFTRKREAKYAMMDPDKAMKARKKAEAGLIWKRNRRMKLKNEARDADPDPP